MPPWPWIILAIAAGAGWIALQGYLEPATDARAINDAVRAFHYATCADPRGELADGSCE